MSDHSYGSETESPPRARGRLGAVQRALAERVRSPAWLSRASGVGLCFSALGFVAALGFALAQGGQIALITRPLPMQVALALPWLVLAFAVATTLGVALAWWRRYWSLAARVHQTVLALLGLAFVWQLWTLGFL